eukprot:1837992-Amphidinium_carterae.3
MDGSIGSPPGFPASEVASQSVLPTKAVHTRVVQQTVALPNRRHRARTSARHGDSTAPLSTRLDLHSLSRRHCLHIVNSRPNLPSCAHKLRCPLTCALPWEV